MTYQFSVHQTVKTVDRRVCCQVPLMVFYKMLSLLLILYYMTVFSPYVQIQSFNLIEECPVYALDAVQQRRKQNQICPASLAALLHTLNTTEFHLYLGSLVTLATFLSLTHDPQGFAQLVKHASSHLQLSRYQLSNIS